VFGLLLLFIAGYLVKQVHTKYQQKRRLLETVVTHSNDGLREIAWTQSHVVRAPLARMMGLINMIEEYDHSKFEIKDVLKEIKKSGTELDQIIREIVKKTETIKKNMENEV
jgi:light-regulated signal transduction histidine kinase (bacteriophytochrome)